MPKGSFPSAVFRALEIKFVPGAAGKLLRLWNKGVVGGICVVGRVGVPKTDSWPWFWESFREGQSKLVEEPNTGGLMGYMWLFWARRILASFRAACLNQGESGFRGPIRSHSKSMGDSFVRRSMILSTRVGLDARMLEC